MAAYGATTAPLRGVVHDPQHRPIAAATLTVRDTTSALSFTVRTGADGAFLIPALPLGLYTVEVAASGFATLQASVALDSTNPAVVHLQLALATVSQSVTVLHTPLDPSASATPTTLISRAEIAATPGADRTNSLAFLTDFVPGAYVTHDQLHIRGGHQVSWLLDGVQIPNTNIASNLGAQIDPKDIDTVAVERGSYAANEGDRTYGVFNVVPRSGFERDREAELVLQAGSYFQTNDQLSLGDHTERFAWYASGNVNRSDFGLSTPTLAVVHDGTAGGGLFSSLLFNRSAGDQLRLVAQLRADHFQIPYDPDPNSFENQQYDSSGLRDRQHESDGLAAFTWAHSLSRSVLLQVSPFIHQNNADYNPGKTDTPVATTLHRSSTYTGGQISVSADLPRDSLELGLYSFGQRESDLFGASFADQSSPDFRTPATGSGGLVEEYVSDSLRVLPGLTATAGLRASQFVGSFTETAVSPRVGLSYRIPRLGWTARGFYGRFYQPPPLLTLSGPLVQYALASDASFQPLHGEFDEEHQFGLAIPWRGWVLDADTFRTRVRNFLDHSNIGDSSLFVPVTVDGALIRAWEVTVRSPRLARRAQLHLAYSNQIAEQRGALTGGLVCAPIASPECDVEPGYTPVDHDQRNTLSVGGTAALPARTMFAANFAYGSGFVNGAPDPTTPYPGAYLPAHSSLDLALSHGFSENLSATVSVTNAADQRVLLDNSLTFGGFHTSDPRQVFGEVRYRFHF